MQRESFLIQGDSRALLNGNFLFDKILIVDFPNGSEMTIEALVHKKLMGNIPAESIEFDVHPIEFETLELADYELDKSFEIDLIIGTKDLGKIWKNGMHRVNSDLVLQNTELSYMVCGSGFLKVYTCAVANVTQKQK